MGSSARSEHFVFPLFEITEVTEATEKRLVGTEVSGEQVHDAEVAGW